MIKRPLSLHPDRLAKPRKSKAKGAEHFNEDNDNSEDDFRDEVKAKEQFQVFAYVVSLCLRPPDFSFDVHGHTSTPDFIQRL